MDIRNLIKEALEKQLITKISVFDFDGTLVDSPLPEYGRKEYEEKTGNEWPHKGWWGREESLDTAIFDIPTIQSVKKTYDEEKNNPNTLMVMLTGRIGKLSNQVESILSSKGFIFDKYIYNNGGSTIDSKINSLNELLNEYPNVTYVLLNDDRLEHIPSFKAWGEDKLNTGRLKSFNINVVPSKNH